MTNDYIDGKGRIEGPFNPDPVTMAAMQPQVLSSAIRGIFGDLKSWRLNRKRVGEILKERGWAFNSRRNTFTKDLVTVTPRMIVKGKVVTKHRERIVKNAISLSSSRGFAADSLAWAFFEAVKAHAEFNESLENASDERINESLAAYNAGYTYASLLAYEWRHTVTGAKRKDEELRGEAVRATRGDWFAANPNKKREPTAKERLELFDDPYPPKSGTRGPKKKIRLSTFRRLIAKSDDVTTLSKPGNIGIK
jgi:hypothetical protein